MSTPAGTGLPPTPVDPFPPVAPGPPNNRLPGWASGDMSDVRQQLLSGIHVDPAAPAGIPLIKVGKATRRGAGNVYGKINPTVGLSPGFNQHDIMKTELTGGVLTAEWGQFHLADLPGGSAHFVFQEDAAGNPELGFLDNNNIAAGAAIAYSKLNLANSIVSNDIVNGTIVNADVAAAAAVDWTKLGQAPAARYSGSAQVIVTATLTNIAWATANYNQGGGVTLIGTTTLQVNITGLWHVMFGCLFPPAAAPVGERLAQVLYNGAVGICAEQKIANNLANANTMSSGASDIRANAGDNFLLQVRHQQGANLTWINDNRTYLALRYVGT
jgi:hypothetical protein